MAVDLNGVGVFLAVARERSFRRAAEQLGVSRPAVSQALRAFEDRVGVALVLRTTRSVNLTEAGRRLYDSVSPAMSELEGAVDEAGSLGARPRGRLRLAVSSIAESFISGPLLSTFVEAYPEIELDVTITDARFDIVDAGYDAGVRLGEVIERNMIAVPVSKDQRQLVVGAPAYLAKAGTPKHPRDLRDHRCIGWRPALDVAPYRWEFEENGREFDVAVPSSVTTNDMGLMIRMACTGGGLTFGMEDTFRPYLERGELVPMLEKYCPRFPGFFLYFPERRNLAPKLRALVDHVSPRKGKGRPARG
jgi:DNA-binding transcriptional LysR family regulator